MEDHTANEDIMRASRASTPLSSVPSSPLSVLSSPLSMRSRSPTPPSGYPSPASSKPTLDSRSPSATPDMSLDLDGPPPAKRRKISGPKERTTEYLDLRVTEDDMRAEEWEEHDFQMQRLLKVLRTRRKIVVVAGAGISVSAGIPDFRSATGLFNSLKTQHNLKASGQQLFDASVYRDDNSTASFHDMVREMSHMTRQAKPTLFHHMLATLAEEGRLLRLYTQNIDGIDTALEPLKTSVPLSPKGPWPKTIQLHGGLEKMVCTKCGELSDFSGELFEGSEAPSCSACEEIDNIRTMMAGKRSHGIGRLRPRIVLYNEYNPDSEAIGAVTHADLKARPDAIIVVGTSMKIPGVKRIVREMCQVTRGRKDGMAIWINQDPAPPIPELKDCWDLVIRGDCDEVARRVALPRWDDKDIGLYNEVTDEEVAATKMKVKIEIEGEVRNKAVDKVQGMVTPSRSPRSRSPAVFKDLKKMKQPQLSFGKGAEKTVEKPAKPASKKEMKSATAKTAASAARRKPVPAKKAAAGGITNAFKTSKVTKVLDGKTEKVAKDSTMRDLPPHHLRRNSELPSATLDGKALVVEIPVSPEAYALETVSPKQIPRGMAHLLDG